MVATLYLVVPFLTKLKLINFNLMDGNFVGVVKQVQPNNLVKVSSPQASFVLGTLPLSMDIMPS